MTPRLPPPLPHERPAQPEHPAPAAAKPTTMEQIQKTVGSVATCIEGVSKIVGFMEKRFGGAKPAAAAFPAAMPALPDMGGFPMMPDMSQMMNPMAGLFPGFPMMPDMGMGMMDPTAGMMNGFPMMPDMTMMGMGFDPNLMMGMGYGQM